MPTRDELYATRALAQRRIRMCHKVAAYEASRIADIERALAKMQEKDICTLDARAAQKVYDALLATAFAENPHRLHITDAPGGMRRVYETLEFANDTLPAEAPVTCPACEDKDTALRRMSLENEFLREQLKRHLPSLTPSIPLPDAKPIPLGEAPRLRCDECGAIAFPGTTKCILHKPLPQTRYAKDGT